MSKIFLIKDGKVANLKGSSDVNEIHEKLTAQGVADYALFSTLISESIYLINSVTHIIKKSYIRIPEYIMDEFGMDVYNKIHENLEINSKLDYVFACALFNKNTEYQDLGGKTGMDLSLKYNEKAPKKLMLTVSYDSKRGSPTDLRLKYLNKVPSLPAGFKYVDEVARMGNGEIATKKSILEYADMYDDEGYTEYEFSTYLCFYVEQVKRK